MKLFKYTLFFIALSFSVTSCRVQLEPIEILTFQQKLDKAIAEEKINSKIN